MAGCAAPAASMAASDGDLFSTKTQVTQHDPLPSLKSLDRSGWEKVSIGPVRADVQHPPRYFTDEDRLGRWVKSPTRPSPLMADPNLEEQTRRATDGGDFQYSTDGWADLGLGEGQERRETKVWISVDQVVETQK